MSNKKTFVVTNGNNRIIHYRKNSPPKKSGILERYTYKTDNGELLPSTSFDSSNKSVVSANSVNKYSTMTYVANRTSQRCMMKSPDAVRVVSSVIPEKMLVKTRNVNVKSENCTVRTEHCDSTTDIDVVTKNKKRSPTKQNDSDSDTDSDNNSLSTLKITKKHVFKKQTNTKSDESDSDCQIVDIQPPDQPKRRTFLKQMEWMIIANKNTKNGSVEVISDSESDSFDLQSNQLTSSDQNLLKNNRHPLYASDDSVDSKKEDNLEPSIYEISDGIQIVLPPESPDKKTTIDTKKPRIEVISNVVVKPKQNEPRPKRTSFESDENVTSSEMPIRETLEREMHRERTPSFNKSPKYDPTLSPESMKTEFYSYLKINTNPLAPKIEPGHQNRRSVRVKNLIEQSEKLKEKELKKRDDVRAKFLKFSPMKIHFPSCDLEKTKISTDFDDFILKYFVKEGINYKNKSDRCDRNTKEAVDVKNKSDGNTKEVVDVKEGTNFKNKSERSDKTKKETADVKLNGSVSPKRETLDQKLVNKEKIEDKRVKTIKLQKQRENLFFKRLLMKQNRGLRIDYSTARMLRNRRILRNSISLTQNLRKKVIKSQLKLKKPYADAKKIEKAVTVPIEKVKPKTNLNVLDKLDLLTQTVMSECSNVQTNSDSDTELPIEGKKISNSKSSQTASDSESEEESPKSPHENCIGFTPDNDIQKIRTNMANLLSNFILNDKERTCFNEKTKTESESVKKVTEPVAPEELPDEEDEELPEKEREEPSISPELFNSESIKSDQVQNYIPLNPNVIKKSFHHSLLVTPKKKSEESSKTDPLYATNSNFSFLEEFQNAPTTETSSKKSRTHEIDIQKQNGPVFNSYYVNCTLIIVQELLISFWKQTPLGNILGAQNMWYSIGNIKRLTLERGCINRRSSEMVLNSDSAVAYIELWTKEHKSDFRETPVTDVFATVYFHTGKGLPDKKVLQLENIKGYGNDVRFAVMKNSREIVVSWYETFSEPTKAKIRSYQLAPDFQTISSTKEMESVEHFILSLHNIGNCDTLILGAGSDQISVWNLTHGWLSTTVSFDTSTTSIHSMCLWAHCETGYLFLLQQIGRGILRLAAVNGASSQWKQLQIYHVPECYESLLGVTIESGILMTCYTNGFLCYDMQSGELLADTETPINRIILPSDKFLVSLDDFKISVKHVMVYVLEN